MIALRRPDGASHQPLSGVTVAPMRRKHLRAVLRIERVAYPRPWSRNLFLSELAQPEGRCYVVALARWTRWWPGREVVGYAGVLVQAGDAHVTTVAVHPALHRRKVATRLLLAVLDGALELGAQSATLEVRAGNRGAQRLYGAFGFAPVGVRKGYYAETGEDAIIMWAHDLHGAEFAQRLEAQRARLEQPGGASGAPDHHVPWVRGRVGLPPADGPDQEAR